MFFWYEFFWWKNEENLFHVQLHADLHMHTYAHTHTEKGWPNTCYGTSKIGLIALTKVLARDEVSVYVYSVFVVKWALLPLLSFGVR